MFLTYFTLSGQRAAVCCYAHVKASQLVNPLVTVGYSLEAASRKLAQDVSCIEVQCM